MTTKPEEAKLRHRLEEVLEDLPNTLPRYDEARLLDDLCFLLHSPLFLYAISLRFATPHIQPHLLPPTPKSITSDKSTDAFDNSYLKIQIKWTDKSWAAQLCYGNNVLLEGRQRNVKKDVGFEQSFFWFCEEASFLAYEYKAREDAWAARKRGEVRCRAKDGRRALKLKIRFRDNSRGRAGIWRVD